MNIKLIRGWLMVSVITVFGGGGALADELLPRVHYEDQLQRCIAAIRSELSVGQDQHLQHHVSEIDKGSSWYSFKIETVVGETIATTKCQSSRFEDRTIAHVELEAEMPHQLSSSR